MSRNGIDLVVVFETTAHRALAGFDAGAADASSAAQRAATVGMPEDRPIYFAVDFDAAPKQQPPIDDYFRGVATELGLAWTGAYAGYWVVSRLFDAGLIRWGWQTYAWSGGNWDRGRCRGICMSTRTATSAPSRCRRCSGTSPRRSTVSGDLKRRATSRSRSTQAASEPGPHCERLVSAPIGGWRRPPERTSVRPRPCPRGLPRVRATSRSRMRSRARRLPASGAWRLLEASFPA